MTRRLQDAGFKAFIVGGAVRDLLLGIEPKDFDIATDARPEQVKPLFRRAFIIGRRFRLVHVHVGAETIEVSTFRAAQTGDDATDEHGRLLSDNVYGSQAEDAARRDFTINALYFDPATEEVWDYVGGVADIRARRLKLIGPPVTRYREDPVRMLRAVRLAAKLGIAIEPKTAAPIPKLAPLIGNVPPARLFDEMQKLLLSGHAVETVKSLRAHGLVARPPAAARRDRRAAARPALHRAGARQHRRARARRPRRVAGVPVRDAAVARGAGDVERGEGARRASRSRRCSRRWTRVLERQAKQLAIPRRFEATIKEIWSLQPRFEQRSGQRPFRLLEHPRFRAGWDFLELRCESGELEGERAGSPTGGTASPTRATTSATRCCSPTRRRRSKRRSRGRGREARASDGATRRRTPTPTPRT